VEQLSTRFKGAQGPVEAVDLRRGKGKEGVDRSFERTSAPLHLGKEKSPS